MIDMLTAKFLMNHCLRLGPREQVIHSHFRERGNTEAQTSRAQKQPRWKSESERFCSARRTHCGPKEEDTLREEERNRLKRAVWTNRPSFHPSLPAAPKVGPGAVPAPPHVGPRGRSYALVA